MKGQSNTEAQTCSICHQRYEGSGHIAAPVKGGRCCNRCNDRYVIPLKIKKMRNEGCDPTLSPSSEKS